MPTKPKTPPTLVLWGKVAELLSELPANTLFPRAISEHPYNLSFIEQRDHAGAVRADASAANKEARAIPDKITRVWYT